jgi:phage shock protein PspC (stress-responsive transcriptional regulator)
MRCHRYGSDRHHKRHRRGPGRVGKTFRHVTQSVADRFGLERRWVIIGFIVGLVVHFPLAVILFLVAWFWADHPGKMEGWWQRGRENFRPTLRTATASAGPAPDIDDTEDPFFDDLRRKFSDLEERARHMEETVTSEEYELRREFRRMSDD